MTDTTPTDRPTRRALFVAILWSLPLSLFVAAELLVRIALPSVDSLAALVRSPVDEGNLRDGASVSIFAADPTLFWRLRANVDEIVWDYTMVSTNDRGLRHPGPIARRSEGDLRIVCLGDSVTFGYRVPLVWADRPDDYDRSDQPWPRLLENQLRTQLPDRSVDVIALAVPGYTSHQGLSLLRRDIAELAPDLVIVQFGWNDVTMRSVADRVGMPADRGRILVRRLVVHSQLLLRLAKRMQHSEMVDRRPPVARVSRDEFVRNHLDVAAVAAAHGAATLFIAPIYRDPDWSPAEAARLATYRAALRDAAAAAGVPYLEVIELTERGHPANDPLFGEAIHPNAAGHRLLADRVLEALAAHGLVTAP